MKLGFPVEFIFWYLAPWLIQILNPKIVSKLLIFSIGISPGDIVDIKVTGAGIINPSPQTFSDKDILEGVANAIEIVVTV
jgi:hypothetical protein